MAKTDTGPKVEETKAQKFHRLATKRLQKTLKDISLMENLASSQYEKTEAQIEYINIELSNAVCRLYEKMNKVKNNKTISVELPTA